MSDFVNLFLWGAGSVEIRFPQSVSTDKAFGLKPPVVGQQNFVVVNVEQPLSFEHDDAFADTRSRFFDVF